MRWLQKYSRKKIRLVSVFLIGAWGAFSQDYDYINYRTKDGLPTNYVYGVIEDDDDYIWAYTENGLSKFDGYTFQNFNTSDGLPDNDIVNAVKDKEGNLVEKLILPDLVNNFYLHRGYKDSKGNFWVGSREGGLFFFPKQKELIQKEKTINRRMAELKLSALRAQMNPHFVFNALGAIQYYIQTNEVEAAAADYLTKFARLMRKCLDSSKQKTITLKNEIEVGKELDTDDIYLPSMLIQPFVENAINHGLDERRDKNGILNIRFYEEKETLIGAINNNGVGQKNTQATRRKGHRSRGIGIIQEKIQTLRSSELFDISIDNQDLDSTYTQYPGIKVILTIKKP